ncbi:hypothetical protein [Halodesulfovibrio sp. MK-HDV]|uniref:hypothetical protein n=1 Tax=Halodesulfovibrio sp. MK-HDV TaxID=2599925 RepID=UPI0013FA9E99|nr:hypothetical protein [Halodesulfovibrio sp. MK-HDV]KAF1076074.1 hypothetical protein MKHDV_01510 [Halodesulfovibrio sp. MK-HDV]
MTLQKLDYRIDVDTNNVAFEIYINGFCVIRCDEDGPIYCLIGVGEYLKPTNNVLRLVMYPIEGATEFVDDSCYCKVTLAARDRFETEQLSAFAGIHYFPTRDHQRNASLTAIKQLPLINQHLGKPRNATDIVFNDDSNHYIAVQGFDINSEYKVWNWANSLELSRQNGDSSPLPYKLRTALFDSYEQLWNAFNKKDLDWLEKLHEEFSVESAEASGISPNDYFESLSFSSFFNDPELSLGTLSFSDLCYSYSLDKKLVTLTNAGGLIRFIRNGDETDYISYVPHFRLVDEKFIISR